MRKSGRRAAKEQLRFRFPGEEEELPRFWQPRFYDFNVYSSKKRREKVEYMHANPVERGLVKNPGHWRWSSFLSYETGVARLVGIDFGI